MPVCRLCVRHLLSFRGWRAGMRSQLPVLGPPLLPGCPPPLVAGCHTIETGFRGLAGMMQGYCPLRGQLSAFQRVCGVTWTAMGAYLNSQRQCLVFDAASGVVSSAVEDGERPGTWATFHAAEDLEGLVISASIGSLVLIRLIRCVLDNMQLLCNIYSTQCLCLSFAPPTLRRGLVLAFPKCWRWPM